jgi:hypothetical protein
MEFGPHEGAWVVFDEPSLLSNSEGNIAFSVPVLELLSSGHLVEFMTIHQSWVTLLEFQNFLQS